MTVHVENQRISSRNRLGRGSLISFNDAWRKLEGLLLLTDNKEAAKITLAAYKESEKDFRFGSWAELSNDLEDAVNKQANGSLSRKNKFFEEGGENNNVGTVIYKSKVPKSSNGWNHPEFFERLGDPRSGPVLPESLSSRQILAAAKSDEPALREVAIKALRRRAEQEYLMQNMAKGPMYEASQIAKRRGFGIAVRGTGLLAHMGIESGAPTKSQEFKNKTSKEIDLWLCDELMPKDLGSVVHYDPRLGWTSIQAARLSRLKTKRIGKSGRFKGTEEQKKVAFAKFTESDWKKKWQHITTKRKLQLSLPLPTEKDARDAFGSRLKEYLEEDYEYRFGHYAPYTELVGPCVRLKLRPKANMYGDHDLFVFTYSLLHGYGKIVQDESMVTGTQVDLQQDNAFQAQHGGIWYWVPGTEFNRGIRAKIMGAHSPPDGEPLVYILPDNNVVTAAFYVPGSGCADKLVSVWECPGATKWLKTTHSGALLLEAL